METLGIYISVPFCRSKCSYCNFASGVFPVAYHERYVDRLIEDIGKSRGLADSLGVGLPSVVDSVYLGGGTPSVLAPELLQRLFTSLRTEFCLSPSAEITLECAPGQIEEQFLEAMVGCGVNRVSFGVQSFIDREAAVTGRLHTREVALLDIERVRAAGIGSVNAALIAGLPHQTAESWRESLNVLIGSGVHHASVYMLEVDEDSRLGREVIDGGGRYHAGAVPSDDLVADFYEQAIDVLAGNGLAQYEISNFARPGAASAHNKKYWQRHPYLGFGLDAHSMLRRSDGAVRFQGGDDLQSYLDGSGIVDIDPTSPQKALEEAWFLGLRMNEGVSLSALEREFGVINVQSFDPVVDRLCGDGLVEHHAGRLRLTQRGRMMSNDVFGRFITEESAAESSLVLVD